MNYWLIQICLTYIYQYTNYWWYIRTTTSAAAAAAIIISSSSRSSLSLSICHIA